MSPVDALLWCLVALCVILVITIGAAACIGLTNTFKNYQKKDD